MLQSFDILISFFGLLFLLLTAFILGKGFDILALKKSKGVSIGLYWQLFIGTFLFISLYAIIICKALTVLLIVPILLYFLTTSIQHKAQEQSKKVQSQFLLFLIISIAFNFSFYLWALHSVDIESVTYVSGDFNIYYKIAQRLNELGIESLNLDPIHLPKYASPYHYGDIWLYAFVSKVISVNPSVVYLVSFTLLSILFINGIYTFIYNRFSQYLEQRSVFLYLLLFAGLFTGFNFFFPRFIVPSAEPYTLSVMNWSKVLVPSTFLVALLIKGTSKNWWAFLLLAIVGGLSFINSLPAIFMSVFLLLTVNWLRKEFDFKQWLVFHVVYVGVTVFFLLVFYKFLPVLLGVEAEEATGIVVEKTIDLKVYLLTAIKIFIGGWFQLFVLTPFALIFLVAIFYKGYFKKVKQLLMQIGNDIYFLIFLVVSGLTCWALLHPFAPDAVQFYTNILAPVYAITISFLAMYILLVVKNKLLTVVTLLTLTICLLVHKNDVFFTNKYNKAEWVKLRNYLTVSNVGPYCVSLRPQGHFNSFFDKNTVYFMPLGFINYIWPDYHNFSLNAPFIPVNLSSPYSNEERVEIEQAPFSIYYRQSSIDKKLSVEQIMNNFIVEQKIGYITVSKDTALPTFFRTIIKDSITLEKANFVVYRIK